MTYHSVSLLKWRQDSRVIQAWRRKSGLAPLPWGGARSRKDAPAQLAKPTVLHLFSPRVLARPADWQESASVAGYCFLELRSAAGEILAASYQPADDLHEFLDCDDRPFYAGFGSMIAPDPAALGSLLVEAARLAGQRLILSPGWGRIVPRTALPASVYLLEKCPQLSMGAIAENPSFRIRAQELQQMLAGEAGVANVVAAIEARLIAACTMTVVEQPV